MALVSVDQLLKNDSIIEAKGKLILYFQKDSNFRKLDCGSTLLFSKTLSPISSSGNPGSFDYQVWCKRQGIFFSVYLSPNDYILLPGKKETFPKRILYNVREIVLDILSRFIPGAKESGFAKALLIGYKDELDKNLVTAYSNTGVVHIIAISGLQLGIIFWLLNLVFRPLQRNPHSRWFAALLILLGLWLFSLLAGAGPSVLRSAIMFSFLIIGNTISKKTSVFNNLATSAFALLCLNTSWLWDAGFQLSYAAVLSIVIFFKPIYNLLYFQNKIVDFAWKLNAVTLSAQVLTFHIHLSFSSVASLFPPLNLFAVPWSVSYYWVKSC
jgi:competence protein ComEC